MDRLPMAEIASGLNAQTLLQAGHCNKDCHKGKGGKADQRPIA